MNKGKPRNSEKKRLSIVIVPHSSNHVKVLRFTSLYVKLLVVLIVILAVMAGTAIYICRMLDENKGLKADMTELYSANSEQRKLLGEQKGTITQLKDKEANFDKNVNSQLDEFDKKFNQITDKYISGQASMASRSGDRNEKTFVDEIKDLKAILDGINGLYDRLDKSQADLSAAEVKLDKYMETVPTLWPVKKDINDYFGYRKDPFTGSKTFHEGLDLGGYYGESIRAAAAGKVILAQRYDGYGLAVIIDHGHGITTLYGHTSKLLVKEGQAVKKGDVIAEMGSSGRSTGPHLHFQVMLYNTPVDPLQYLDEK
jgi:murein DD-endopeptidase MepM/ murein hydrolase activator NlpD